MQQRAALFIMYRRMSSCAKEHLRLRYTDGEAEEREVERLKDGETGGGGGDCEKGEREDERQKDGHAVEDTFAACKLNHIIIYIQSVLRFVDIALNDLNLC